MLVGRYEVVGSKRCRTVVSLPSRVHIAIAVAYRVMIQFQHQVTACPGWDHPRQSCMHAGEWTPDNLMQWCQKRLSNKKMRRLYRTVCSHIYTIEWHGEKCVASYVPCYGVKLNKFLQIWSHAYSYATASYIYNAWKSILKNIMHETWKYTLPKENILAS